MKHLFFILFVIILVSNYSYTQDLTTSKNTVVKFSAIFSGIIDKLDPYEPKTTREKNKLTANRKYLNQAFHNQLHDYLSKKLSDKSIVLQPINSLQDFGIVYLTEGYPNPLSVKGAIKKAQKKGHETDHYIVCKFSVGEALDLLAGKKLKQIKPEASATLNVMGLDGKAIKEYKHKSKGEKSLKSKDVAGSFDKLEESHYDVLLEELLPLVYANIDAVIDQI